jgi:hypothetical protein
MQVDPQHDRYAACAGLLYQFMNISLPELWRTKPAQFSWIKDCRTDEETVAPFDRFVRWESLMSQMFAPTMQETYTTLGFDRAQQAQIVSRSGADWTFLVYVIRYEFLKLQLASGTRKPITDHALNMQLLDRIEREMLDTRRTPSPNAAPRRDTPELEKEPNNNAYFRSLVVRLPEPDIDLMLTRLHDFIE